MTKRTISILGVMLLFCLLIFSYGCGKEDDENGNGESIVTNGDSSTDGEQPTDGETTPDGETPVDGETPTDGEEKSECLKLTPLENPKHYPEFNALMSLRFTVDTCDGEPVTGLDSDKNFTISEDGNPLSARESSQKIIPKSVGFDLYTILILDLSGSITYDTELLEKVKEVSKSFVDIVLHKEEGKENLQKVAIYGFAGEDDIKLIADFQDVNGKENLIDNIDSIDDENKKLIVPGASTNLNGAVISGLSILNSKTSGAGEKIIAGTMVLFNDGRDRAGLKTHEEAKNAVSNTTHTVIPVALESEDLDLGALEDFKKGADLFYVENVDDLKSKFTQMAELIKAKSERYYMLAYCSASRAGTHTLTLTATKDDVTGSFEKSYNADGFTDGCYEATIEERFYDLDKDGFLDYQDCDDKDNDRYPGATDTVGDNKDQNCDDMDGVDADSDGYASNASGGDDCDDTDKDRYPGASDTVGDNKDQNCDDMDGVDSDGDGYASKSSGGIDCNDSNKDINPGAEEIPDNGIDEDCNDGDLVTTCKENKVADMGIYYIDKYEASRPDATADSVGSINVRACSVSGVLPWVSVNWNDARAACEASGKRLCKKDEWGDACDGIIGEGGYKYPYGDMYQDTICNGSDAAGHGKAMPTGYMAGCISEDGAYDMIGNVFEWSDEQSGDDRVLRGGIWRNSYIDTLTCSYRISTYPTGTYTYVGFRCCQDK